MVFGQLSVFATLGPACAVAILIGFSPPSRCCRQCCCGLRDGDGVPRAKTSRRYWNRIAVLVVRRPAPLLAVSLVGLTILSVTALGIQITYDDRDGQPTTTDSNEGYALLNRHFPQDITIAEFVVVDSPTDLRTTNGLADLDQMAARIAQIPGVTRVVGVTRPTGAKLEQAQLSWQNGQIGDRVAGSVGEAKPAKVTSNNCVLVQTNSPTASNNSTYRSAPISPHWLAFLTKSPPSGPK